MELPDEPAWVTRFSKGNADCSPFAAREIADQVRQMLAYRKKLEAVAAEMLSALVRAEKWIRVDERMHNRPSSAGNEVREVIAKAERIGNEL